MIYPLFQTHQLTTLTGDPTDGCTISSIHCMYQLSTYTVSPALPPPLYTVSSALAPPLYTVSPAFCRSGLTFHSHILSCIRLSNDPSAATPNTMTGRNIECVDIMMRSMLSFRHSCKCSVETGSHVSSIASNYNQKHISCSYGTTCTCMVPCAIGERCTGEELRRG